MCIIFRIQQGQKLGDIFLSSAQSYNPDGVGIVSWDSKGSPIVKLTKWTDMFEDLLDEVKGQCGRNDIWVHFRMATHGKVSRANTHPFSLGNGWWFMHNGVLSGQDIQGDESDTAAFVRTKLLPKIKKYGELWLKSREFHKILEDESSRGNRFLLIGPWGYTYKAGAWSSNDEGLLVSNIYAWRSVKTACGRYSEGGEDAIEHAMDEIQSMTKYQLKDWVFENPDLAADVLHNLIWQAEY